MPRSYFTNLRKGRIENPGYEKMLAIARAMGFPPALWFDEMPGDEMLIPPAEGQDLASRVGHLFDTIRHPGTGEPYTNAEVARISAGGLTEGDVERIRTGTIADPTVGQVVSLAAVFGVEPSYLVDRGEPPTLDAELLEDSRDNPRGSAPAGARKGYRPRDSAAMRGGTLGAATKRSGRR